MKSKFIIFVILALLVGLAIGYFVFRSNSPEPNNPITQSSNVTKANCVSEDCLKVSDLEYPAGSLPKDVVDAMSSAIDDEYKAHATYEAVIDKLGPVRPFSMIIRAEEQHIASLKALYDKYGATIPQDPYTNVAVKDTKSENCAVGVQAEIDNAALYRDKLLPVAKDYPDITQVFTQLMNASQDNHLPAFQRCAS